MADVPALPNALTLRDVQLRFPRGGQGEEVLALDGVSLTVRSGEFVALLGPSGCGKSSVLRLVAGLLRPTAGSVEAPACRSGDEAETAFVFQEPTLMPWASVADNVGLALRLQGWPKARWQAQVRQVLHQVGLATFDKAHPAQLSGGMKMRASIARALVTRPRVLLMDEPFAALDEITRQRLNHDLLEWWQAQGPAALFVTHSVAEAVFLSQRVLVMAARPGRIVAEHLVQQAYPRAPGWRHSAEFVDACRQVAADLALAGIAGQD